MDIGLLTDELQKAKHISLAVLSDWTITMMDETRDRYVQYSDSQANRLRISWEEFYEVNGILFSGAA